jgi:hypothetical protein
MEKREPTVDELAGITWWNSMTEAERAAALAAAGWKARGNFTPSAADAWARHKQQQKTLKMQQLEIIRVELELPDLEALALAQLVKRITWEAMRECSANEDECYRIRAAVERLRRALGEVGYAPR